ncbi:ABC transporter permease [Anaerosporobacter faecicola]|uniref:ABC transporter permease n=1 Tax=Anaerosporobacter faecicola TaxID=2718714 RepID=UPI001439389F|nr:ABC transporter permease [Anaerosporobacter faecicola]
MKGFFTMLKLNGKLLLRSKGYLCCLILIPIIAVIMMNTVGNFGKTEGTEESLIKSWDSIGDTSDIENVRMSIKVYDKSNSVQSNYLLEQLAKTSSYKIYRLTYKEGEEQTEKEILDDAKSVMESSTIRAALVIPEDFVEQLQQEENSAVQIIMGYEDERVTLLQNNVNQYCGVLHAMTKEADATGQTVENILLSQGESLEKEVISVKQSDIVSLNEEQQNSRSRIGYALCFLTISFVFSGVFIVNVLIQEKDNRSYNRMKLSLTTSRCYIAVKLCMVLVTSIVQVAIFAIVLALTTGTNLGIPYGKFLLMIFLQGILFNFISLVLGILCNNLMGVTFLSFVIWCVSTLIAGLYFPIVSGSVLEKISNITPQRWFMKATEFFIVGEKGVLLQYVLVICGFFLIMFTIGLVGMKRTEKE